MEVAGALAGVDFAKCCRRLWWLENGCSTQLLAPPVVTKSTCPCSHSPTASTTLKVGGVAHFLTMPASSSPAGLCKLDCRLMPLLRKAYTETRMLGGSCNAQTEAKEMRPLLTAKARSSASPTYSPSPSPFITAASPAPSCWRAATLRAS